jgi:molybdopterin/thiamine biosynthesis adenylyltransferase
MTLANARILIVGLGGLGTPAAAALAAAGAGTLVLADPDVVDRSNLHRQPLYDETVIGRPKAEAAAARLREGFPGVCVEPHVRRLGETDAALCAGADVILDGTDSIPAKFLVNDLAVATGRPLIHAGVTGMRAQLLTVLPRASTCYRCVFEAPPPAEDAVSCTDTGVLGPLPALAGALQAAEAVRLTGGERPLFADRMLTIDAWGGTWRSVPLARRLTCAACGEGPEASTATRSVVP